MQRRRDKGLKRKSKPKPESTSYPAEQFDMGQRPSGLRSGRSISSPSNPRKNVLLTEPVPSPLAVDHPTPRMSILGPVSAPAPVFPPISAPSSMRPGDSNVRYHRRPPPPNTMRAPEQYQRPETRRHPSNGTNNPAEVSSLVPSFVTVRSECDLPSPQASSDLDHTRSSPPFPPPLPVLPSSAPQQPPSVNPVSMPRSMQPMRSMRSTDPVRENAYSSSDPPYKTDPRTSSPRVNQRPQEAVRADLLAALESTEPVVLVSRPPPARTNRRI